jgi:hypothetical protein
MLKVELMPEPSRFQADVRTPGLAAIQRHEQSDSKLPPHWRNVLPELREASDCICAYSATRIPHSVGLGTVDHFIPKSLSPHLAYEWKNFRYASSRINARKRDYTDVIDPCRIGDDWFSMDFPSMIITPSSNTPGLARKRISETISRLKLNLDSELISERLEWLLDFVDGHVSFEYLTLQVPFISRELRRQNLIQFDADNAKPSSHLISTIRLSLPRD